MVISRTWAMPNPDTFSVKPIGEFVKRYLSTAAYSADPFSRNKRWATYTNDLDPNTEAESHLDAAEFLSGLAQDGVMIDLLIFDPPYSPRQISEVYTRVGREVGMVGTQNGALYKRVRDAAMPILSDDATVLSFGWNSAGMGKSRGFEIVEILLVAHGGGHNDTICVAEKRIRQSYL